MSGDLLVSWISVDFWFYSDEQFHNNDWKISYREWTLIMNWQNDKENVLNGSYKCIMPISENMQFENIHTWSRNHVKCHYTYIVLNVSLTFGIQLELVWYPSLFWLLKIAFTYIHTLLKNLNFRLRQMTKYRGTLLWKFILEKLIIVTPFTRCPYQD